jgi:hypothetical protein
MRKGDTMAWTRGKPTVPGTYWYKSSIGQVVSVDITHFKDNKTLVVWAAGICIPFKLSDIHESAEWIGPLAYPNK